ncbi:MAG TPA: WXG100 family type VII secretion target [Pseudonocardiaceae bacterium]|jgi:uncharacterized protein YukE|nr:WXG100 family type VII secretion target [Pseudonocardiaceae bacterium]
MSQLDVTTSNETTGAGVIDSWHSFASSIESIKNAHGADKAAVAVEVGVTGASAVLDTVAFALDPLAKLISAGLGWLIEHVEFLRWPLDQIAGNPDAIQDLANQLHTIGQNLRNSANDLDSALKTDITNWQGQAADQFNSAMNGHKTHVDDAGHSVDTVGYVVETTMALIAAVRSLFRDIITTVLGDIIATMLVALAAAVFTFGASIAVGVTKCVIEGTVQVASMMAKLAKVGDLAARTASRIGQLTKMTKGETQAGHELTDLPTTTHAPTPDPHAAPTAHPTTNTATEGDTAPGDAAPPPTAHPTTNTATEGDTPPAAPAPPPTAHPSTSTTSSSADDAPAPPVPHGDDAPAPHTPGEEEPVGDPNASDYSAQQGILDDYHNNPEGQDDYSAQQGVLDEYHNPPGDDAASTHTTTSSADTPPEPLPPETPTPTPAPAPHDEPAPAVNQPHDDEEPPAEQTPPTEQTPPAEQAPAAPKPPDPKSALKDQDISLLKKHEDWLKNNFKESQAKAKFVDNWVKKNAPDSYPLVKAMADAKSSKNWVGWVDKSAVQVDKQLTDIQQKAEAAWQQSNDQWRAQHPDPATAS